MLIAVTAYIEVFPYLLDQHRVLIPHEWNLMRVLSPRSTNEYADQQAEAEINAQQGISSSV
jgi:hypothetical protein